jgi:transposase
MLKCVLGIDIAKLKFDAALLIDKKYKMKVFDNNAQGYRSLCEWLDRNGAKEPHICMEATGVYGEALSYYLLDRDYKVSVVNPAQIKGFGQSELARTKTDKADSKLIARFCQAMNPPLWCPAPENLRILHSLVERLEDLQKLERAELNRLEVSHDFVKKSIKKTTKFLAVEIKEIKKRIRQLIKDDPELRGKKDLLKTIPGVGNTIIAQILSMQCTPERFKNVKQLAAFVGLDPRHRQSGTSVFGRSTISKTGHSSLRKSLYMPAIVAKQHNPILKAFYERLLAAGKSKKLAICAVMRKLLHIIYGVLKSGKPFDANLAMA